MTGVAPVSLLLFWFGEATAASSLGAALWVALLAGGLTLVPLAVAALNRRRHSRAAQEGPPPGSGGPAP